MKRTAAWILAASLAVGMLAGCGATTPSPQGTQTPGAAQPAAQQVLTLNLTDEAPGLDSATSTDQLSFIVLNQVEEGLVRPGQNGDIKPGSGEAASWTVSPDGLVYTFTLKDGLKWNDGKPVTSQDFAYAWLRALDPKVASQYNYQLFYIKGAEAWSSLDTKAADFAQKYDALKKQVAIETPDAKTIKVTLATPTPYFLGLTAFPTYFPQRQDVVEKYGDKFGTDADKIAFNGPFTVKSWTHQSEIVLDKNANYWDAANVKLQTVDFKMVKDSMTAINMYEAGQLDAVGLPGTLLAQYKDKPGFVSQQTTTSWYLEFNLNNKAKPYLQNQHIRNAFNLALDRQSFVDGVLRNGSAPALGLVPSTIHIGGKSYRDVAGNFLSAKADATKAQAELAAGLKELGLDKLPAMDFLTSNSDLSKKYAQGVQGMIAQNLPGVTLNIVPLDFKVRLDRMRKGDFDVVMAGWGADYDDPNTFMNLFITGGQQNDPKWSNAQYDKLVTDAGKTSDQAVRAQNFAAAEKILMTELPIVPLYINTNNSIRKPYVHGILDQSVGPDYDLKNVTIDAH